MYGCESWTIKKTEHWRIDSWTVVLEKTLESPLGCKEIKPVNPKANQSWIFIGRTDAETSILWPPNVKNWLIGKRPWYWERLNSGGEGDDQGWDGWMPSWVNGHEFEQTPGVGDRQGSLVCCSPWGCKKLNMTEWLNWTGSLKRGKTSITCMAGRLAGRQVIQRRYFCQQIMLKHLCFRCKKKNK